MESTLNVAIDLNSNVDVETDVSNALVPQVESTGSRIYSTDVLDFDGTSFVPQSVTNSRKQDKSTVTTYTVDTPVFTNQPTIVGGGALHTDFKLWNDDYYFVTLLELDKVATQSSAVFTATTVKIDETTATFAIGNVISITGSSIFQNNISATITNAVNNGTQTTYTFAAATFTAGTSTTTITIASHVALPAGQFKLMLWYDCPASAVNQIFSLTGLVTGNSGTLVENYVVDFKTIGVSWTMRCASVSEVVIITSPEKWHKYNINMHIDFVQIHSLYVSPRMVRPAIRQTGINNGTGYIINGSVATLNAVNILFQTTAAGGVPAGYEAYKYFGCDLFADIRLTNKSIQSNCNATIYPEYTGTQLTATVSTGVGTLHEASVGDMPNITNISVSENGSGGSSNRGKNFRNGTIIIVEDITP